MYNIFVLKWMWRLQSPEPNLFSLSDVNLQIWEAETNQWIDLLFHW